MRLRPVPSAAPLALGLLLTSPALAADLTVGPGKTYATPCAAIGKASPGDTVLVSPGTSAYTDSCEINVANLMVQGVDGQPKIDLSGTQDPADDKGIFVVNGDNVTLENLELTGANVDDNDGSNGAAIRDQATGLLVRSCYIHDNQDGILATPAAPGSTLVVEYSRLDHNALGDGCASSGCTHNIYVGSANMETFVFAFNWSHNINSGLASGTGHLLKTRAQKSYILYNALLGEDGADSYELDVPQGGLAVIVGNILQKPSNSGNGSSLSYGEEGLLNTISDIFVASNTFYSDASATTFIHIASGATLTAHNNLFGSSGTPSTTGTLSADNLQPASPKFVDAPTFNFHLLAGSPAIGHGVTPGSADGFSLVPVYEYVQPDESVARASGASLDVGAFQYGTNVSGAGQIATITVGDAGTPILPDAGSKSAGDSGVSEKSDGGSSTGAAADAGKGHESDAGVAHHGRDAGTKGADATVKGDAAAGSSGSSGGCSVGARAEDVSDAWWVGLGVAALVVSRRRRQRPLSVPTRHLGLFFGRGMPKPPPPRSKIPSGVSFVEEPDYGVRPQKTPPKTGAPLDEVERALALLDGRHPDALRVERQTQAALAAKKAAVEARAGAARREDKRRWLIRGTIGLVVIVPLALGGVFYARRAARTKAVEAALAPSLAPYLSRGFVPVGPVKLARESVELDVTGSTCFMAIASRSPGDGKLIVERPGGSLEGEDSVAWCTCGAEAAAARLRATGPEAEGGLVVLRTGVADVGGHQGLFFLDPRPHVIAPPDECSHDALDAWIDTGNVVRAKDEALDEEMRATLGRAGFTVAGSAVPTLPFAIVPGTADGCALAWSSSPHDTLGLRLKGGARPLSDVAGPIGFCARRAESVTVWRAGEGEVVVERVAAGHVGGTHGLREVAPRLGLSGVTAWVSDDDLAWDATATLRGSGVVPSEITVSSNGSVVKDARLVALSIDGATVVADTPHDGSFTCEPPLTPTTRSTVCIQSAALPWRTVGAASKAGIAESTLPFWLEASAGATDPRALATQLSLVKLGRRLLANGFEATSRDGVTDVDGGTVVVGRGGSDGVVAVQISRDRPWASPCGNGDAWTLDGDPAIVSLAAGAQVRLTCTPRAASDHRTVVFRHVGAKLPGR